MCPPSNPSSPAEIGVYWSDEQIFSILHGYRKGLRLPNNVLTDSSPYQHRPSNLPEGIWYLVNSNDRKESVYGLWRAKGEACKIYSKSLISGWRATLEYFEGQSPRARKTNWLMQEYSITLKKSCAKNESEDSMSLCRVFLCNGSSSENEMCSKDCYSVIGYNEVNLEASIIPITDSISEQFRRKEAKEKRVCDAEFPLAYKMAPNSSLQEISEMECFSLGDYLELDDLEEPESRSSSSQNSSCPSTLSDKYFDTLALLRDLEEEDVVYSKTNHSSSRYSFCTSVGSNVVMLPPSSGSMDGDAASTSVNDPLLDKNDQVLENATKRRVLETTNGGTSGFCYAATRSPGGVNTIPKGGKKAASGGKGKRPKMYFCFIWF